MLRSSVTSHSKLEQLRALLEDETNPEKLLCRCLGIADDIHQLDEKMTSFVECLETLRQLSFAAKNESVDGMYKLTIILIPFDYFTKILTLIIVWSSFLPHT